MLSLIARSLSGLLVLVAVPAFAQGLTLPVAAAPAAEVESTEIDADRIEGTNEESLLAEGSVRLNRGEQSLSADRLRYRIIEQEIEADGNVVLSAPDYELSGPRLVLRMADHTGHMETPSYRFTALPGRRKVPKAGKNPEQFGPKAATSGPFSKAQGARGEAKRIEIEGENQYRMDGATYSTCKPGDDSWFAQFSELSFDYDRFVGEGYGAKVVFKGVPILYMPYLNFPLSSGRRSGFLSPTIGGTSNSGFEWQLPYYWNIAPNLDATITVHDYASRGTMLGIDQRYLFPGVSGEWHADYLGSDRQAGRDRSSYRWRHQQSFPYGISGGFDVAGVSDDTYFSDFSTQISTSSQTLVPKQFTLNWAYEGWVLGARTLEYQVLQPDPAVPPSRPYELLPQVTINGRSLLADYVETALGLDYTNFKHRDPARIQGERTVLYPRLALPMVWPGYYITPRFGVHDTRYAFASAVPGVGENHQRTVPISSLDTGLVFEREAHAFGRRQIQTLEPRLFYLKVPFRDQSALTNAGVNFDSGVLDFNFAQIFAENLFSGQDRIAEADQVTVALTSRLIDQDSGKEYFRAMFGQRYYFDSQRVTLNPADSPRTEKKTDMLGAISGELLPKTFFDGAVQYNPRDQRLERFNLAARYQPAVGEVINAAYRFSRLQTAPFDVDVRNIDLSAQW
ncbi:MAG TPA: LPS assembly protein LptD, partial [Rhodocyclaceae bacterium]|nr:LPS assembly protein LptD [Rhodocyclaceae bacterium]